MIKSNNLCEMSIFCANNNVGYLQNIVTCCKIISKMCSCSMAFLTYLIVRNSDQKSVIIFVLPFFFLSLSRHSHLVPGFYYSWIGCQVYAHNKLISEQTRRTATNPRRPLERSRRGDSRSALAIFV